MAQTRNQSIPSAEQLIAMFSQMLELQQVNTNKMFEQLAHQSVPKQTALPMSLPALTFHGRVNECFETWKFTVESQFPSGVVPDAVMPELATKLSRYGVTVVLQPPESRSH